MEVDSSLPALALAISLASFLLITVGEAGLATLRRESIRRLAELEPDSSLSAALKSPTTYRLGLLTPLKLLAMSASLLSAVALVISAMGARWMWIALVSLAVLALLVILDTAGKRLVFTAGKRATVSLTGRLRKMEFLLRPLSAVHDAIAQWLVAAQGGQTFAGSEAIALDLAIPIEPGEEPLDAREVRMIRGVVEQDKTVAREIMVPRVDMVTVEIDTSVPDLAERMVESGHSRIPVFAGDLDQIEGIAHARDILRVMSGDAEPSPASLSDVIRPPLYIPESKTLEELFGEFKEQRVHMAIVVDEYGGVSGLVTIEDLLEEIVGEILDEFDVNEPVVEEVSERELIVDARASVDRLKDVWGVAVVGEGFDTMGGFVSQRLGKIPSSGDTVEYDGLRIEVISTVGRRPKKLRVTRTPPNSHPTSRDR